ncbi:T7SS effector LXG polymorphic toxin, partial [Heyndrickxia sporothermodurans]|uniref:T7SS effector LXG polymorphic toxin n=1 Tax=Heyndrickxia sporothermodurans TaxID=46224 RepID=UPI003D231D5A
EQIEQLQHAIDGIITLEDSLKGNSGEAIRSYYQEIHQTFLLFFQSFLANYDTMIENMKHSLRGLEPHENGFINEVFLDYNLEYGLKKVESVTRSLTDEGNRIMQKVSDIVHLPKLQDDETMHQIKRAKEKVKTTLHQLHSFDQQATRSLDSVRKDIITMSRFIEQMDSNLKGNKQIITNFTPKKLMDDEAYRSLLGEFVQKGNLTPIQTIKREPYGNYKSIKYQVYPDGLIVMEYQKIGKDSTVYYEVVTDIPKEVEDGATVGIIEPTIDKILKGIYVGSGKAVGDTIEGWKGLYKLAEKYLGPTPSPDLLLKAGLIGSELYLDAKAVFGRAVDTGKYMVKAIKDGFVRDVIEGDAESRSKYFTYLFTTLGIGVLSDKGISKIGKIGTKVGGFGGITTKVEGLSPSLGTVNAGPIPYNVMNHLEDQVQLVARKAFGDGTKGTGKVAGLKSRKLSSEQIELDWLADKYTAVEVKGTVKVGGKEVDVSRRVYQIKIDKNYVPNNPKALGKSNGELMKKGKSPYIVKDGVESKVELHHLIQKEPGGMVEIAELTHDKYDLALHGLVENGKSFRNNPELEKMYNNFRSNYWKMRASE